LRRASSRRRAPRRRKLRRAHANAGCHHYTRRQLRPHSLKSFILPHDTLFSLSHSTLDLPLSRHWTGTICTRNDKSTSPPSTLTTFARCSPSPYETPTRTRGGRGRRSRKIAGRADGTTKRIGSAYYAAFLRLCAGPTPFVFLSFPRLRLPAGLSSRSHPGRAARILRFLGFLFHSVKCFYDYLVSCYTIVPSLSFFNFFKQVLLARV